MRVGAKITPESQYLSLMAYGFTKRAEHQEPRDAAPTREHLNHAFTCEQLPNLSPCLKLALQA